MRQVVVLDRDGLLTRQPPPREYLRQPEEIVYLSGVKEALRRLAAAGFRFVIATNQMGVALGMVTAAEAAAVNERIKNDLAREGVQVLGVYVCPHRDEDFCACRKPRPGLLVTAARELGFSPSECWNIGDSPRDILMGIAAGCKNNILVRSGYAASSDELAQVQGVVAVATLVEAADYILQNSKEESVARATEPSDKIKTVDELGEIAERARVAGKRVVLCHGTFDLLHPGHIRHLVAAKRQGDLLLVTVTRDAFVNKGPGRPAFPENLRAESLAAVYPVDYVALNDPSSDALPAIEKIRPDVFVKGSEYGDSNGGFTGARQKEREAVERYGGRVAYTDEITFSSTQLINKFFNVYPPEAEEYLRGLRRQYKVADALAALERLRTLRVLVLGDAVIDEYHYTRMLGKTGKENLLASKFESEETFPGGVFALANQLAGFAGSVELLTVLGERDSREQFIRAHLKDNISPKFFYRADTPTTVKRRYIDATFLNKLFEVYFFDDSPLSAGREREIWQYLEQALPKTDCVVVLDYAHGFLSGNLINLICGMAPFLAVNTQTNAANTGFNLITKYPRADFICVSEPELRLAMRDRHTQLEPLIRRVSEQLFAPRVVITRGPSGCVGYSGEQGFARAPAFSGKVLDRVGAGDAFLSLAAPLTAAGVSMDLVCFLASIAGALAVTIVGNRSPVEYKDVARAVKTMLA
ncbi:HAD-IIIA family hydrolase [Patescibacteria group bacterium]|nr:MAG: HAD-IIIA family hydrolase [Patescibacteria group bacterium]